jgi:putative two-component system response regulator
MAASIALTHHERWDGRGYPCGLIGDNIPLDGRIAALADAYDAICSERPYKEPVSEDEACEILKPEAGKHFDPSVFAAFSRAKRQVREIRARYPDEAFAPPDEIRDATQFLFC